MPLPGTPYGGRNPAQEISPEDLEEDTPDEVSDFMAEHNVGDKFTCTLKQYPREGGAAETLKPYRGYKPTIDEIGKQWGPGDYGVVFYYKGAPGPDGKRPSIVRECRFSLPERAWRIVHDEFLRERSRINKEKLALEVETATVKAQIQNAERGVLPGAAPTAPDPIEALKSTASVLKDLGVPIGGSKPSMDIPGLVTAIAAVVGAVAPLFKSGDSGGNTSLIASLMDSNQKNMLAMFGMMMQMNGGQQGGNKYMEQILNMALGAMGKVKEFGELMRPEDKPAMIDRIFDLVAKGLPQILELAKMSKEEREKSFLHKAASETPEMKAAKSDPEINIGICNRLDKQYGFQTANEILDVAGVPRHPSTLQNKENYPSPGYNPDGTTQSAAT